MLDFVRFRVYGCGMVMANQPSSYPPPVQALHFAVTTLAGGGFIS